MRQPRVTRSFADQMHLDYNQGRSVGSANGGCCLYKILTEANIMNAKTINVLIEIAQCFIDYVVELESLVES